MARLADDQGLAPTCRHTLDPAGFFPLPWLVQVGELAEVMALASVRGTTALADLRPQALDPLTACPEDVLWRLSEDGLRVPAEFEAAKPGYQGLFALTSGVLHRKDSERARGCRPEAPILAVDPVDGRAVLIREGLHRGPVPDPVDAPQAMDIGGQEGVRHEAPRFRLGLRHKAVVGLGEARCPGGRFAPAQVFRALGSEDIQGDLQTRRAVDTAPSSGTVLLVVGVLVDDRIAEDARGFCPRIRNQGLLLGALAFELPTQELRELTFDRFSLLPWATAPQQPIVRVPSGPASAKVRVVGIARGQAVGVATPRLGPFGLARHPWLSRGLEPRQVRWVWLPSLSAVIGWQAHPSTKLLQAIQGEVTAEGAHHAALRHAAERCNAPPVRPISSLKPMGHQP